MSFASACLAWEAAEAAKVMYATWGHLEPKLGVDYPGKIWFIVGGYQAVRSQPADASFEFDGGPGFYSDMVDFIDTLTARDLDHGMWLWEGVHRKCKNGVAQFKKGTIRLLAPMGT